MDEELKRIKKEMKMKRQMPKKVSPIRYPSYLTHFVGQCLCAGVLLLLTLIFLKGNTHLKQGFYQQVYEKNFSFASVNAFYQKYFGSSIPFSEFFMSSTPVFQEKLKYQEANKYKDGVKLSVEEGYLIPNQQSGLVVFLGEKEGYGKTLVIQQMDGIDLWYCNIDTTNVKLYDYVEKGSLLGSVKNSSLILVYKKDGKVLDYKDYI